ncbi:hypothetical protein KTS45_09975 [Halomicroarcula limicola]|uniref:Small CPxCG-related zinc finger protein n=1 Tax=Haloarcula limicola TaxID=1429915 RepID=A0A8J7Y4D1_9EURY|nr:hypothetical protein [Halomicroarcula limicola]MBV0924525.1 hypothetical protein [Halomicroarcula limicola]
MSYRNAWQREDSTVVCVACGEAVSRDDAREYDKFGDRWDRDEKEFEYLCTPCDRARSHSPRRGLEDRLVEAGAGAVDRATFLRRYCALSSEDDAPPENRRR